MVWLPWAAMMAISVYEYGYGAAEEALQRCARLEHVADVWLLSIWAFSRRASPFPRESSARRASFGRTAMLAGLSSRGGFISIANSGNLVIAISVRGMRGIGAGLVYARASTSSGKWYRSGEAARPGSSTAGLPTALWPFIFIFSYALHPNTYVWVLDLVALYMLVSSRVRTALPGPAEELVAVRR